MLPVVFGTARGLALERLSELADMHRNYVGSVERGERNIALDNILALARALNVPMSELFAGIEAGGVW